MPIEDSQKKSKSEEMPHEVDSEESESESPDVEKQNNYFRAFMTHFKDMHWGGMDIS